MFPPQSTEAKVYEEWANKIAADSSGVLSVRLYPAGTLIAPPDILEGVKSGVADIGSGFALKPEGHEISNFLSFAMAAPDIESAARAYDVLWDKLPDAMADEWKEYKVLWLAPTVPQTLWFRDKEVKTLEDMKGLQLRVPNRDLAKLITEFGATPTSMSAADLAIGLEKGTVDGATNTWPSTVANKMKLQYAVELQTGSFGIATPLFVVMNQSSYEKLDPALQEVIDDSLMWGREKTIATWGTAQQDAYTAFEKGGGKYITLAPEEEAKWFETYLRVQAESAKELDAKGIPGTQILETLQQALAENAG
jgi:TRAP-type C4-dicarboxylate transport system substrate-binding protein